MEESKGKIYYAHSKENLLNSKQGYDLWQTLQDHAYNVGKLAANFAEFFRRTENSLLHWAVA
ncbi:Uncharacterised protein [Stutzerimonas stutzeri]|nr:Uncharacterised protein [Stutzerimonas stutzeri]